MREREDRSGRMCRFVDAIVGLTMWLIWMLELQRGHRNVSLPAAGVLVGSIPADSSNHGHTPYGGPDRGQVFYRYPRLGLLWVGFILADPRLGFLWAPYQPLLPTAGDPQCI